MTRTRVCPCCNGTGEQRNVYTGAELAAIRRSYGVTRAALAAQMGMSESNVKWWENQYTPMTPVRIVEYLDAMGRTIQSTAINDLPDFPGSAAFHENGGSFRKLLANR